MSLLSLYGGEFYPESNEPNVLYIGAEILTDADTSIYDPDGTVGPILNLKKIIEISSDIDLVYIDASEICFELLETYGEDWYALAFIPWFILSEASMEQNRLKFFYTDAKEFHAATGLYNIDSRWMRVGHDVVDYIATASFTNYQVSTSYSSDGEYYEFLEFNGKWFYPDGN